MRSPASRRRSPVDPQRASIWTTGTDGRYRIRGLAKGKVTRARGRARATRRRARARSRSSRARTSTGVDIVLTPGTFVFGKVTDQHGVPVVGAQVTREARGRRADRRIHRRRRQVPARPDHRQGRAPRERVRSRRRAPRDRSRAGQGARPRPSGARTSCSTSPTRCSPARSTTRPARRSPARNIEVIGGAGEGRRAVVGADGTFSIDMLPRGHAARARRASRLSDRRARGRRVDDRRARAASPRARRPGRGRAARRRERRTDRRHDDRRARARRRDRRGDDRQARALWKLGPLEPGRWQLDGQAARAICRSRATSTSRRRARRARRRCATSGSSSRAARSSAARCAIARGQRVAGAHITVRRADGSGEPVEADADGQGEFAARCPTGDVEPTAAKRLISRGASAGRRSLGRARRSRAAALTRESTISSAPMQIAEVLGLRCSQIGARGSGEASPAAALALRRRRIRLMSMIIVGAACRSSS